MVQLPNTDVRNCDHDSHGDAPARAVTQIRFAVEGEVKEFWGCLAHRHATDFGYVSPNANADREALAAAAETDKPEEAVDDLASAAPQPPDEPPNEEVSQFDTSVADDDEPCA